MVSIEKPPSDPSCSSDLVPDCHEAPSFSIRDYAFKSRSKDISANWPFPQHLLQLCLDNGIRDVLPPFQTSNLVRSHCLRKVEEYEPLAKYRENKTTSENVDVPADSVVDMSSDRYKVHHKDISDDKWIQIESEINASSMTSCDLIENRGVSNKQHLESKCRLAEKSCTLIETKKTEDLVSSLTAVADPMASKVCPVCKSFTSSSNTTLNAHIDRCLALDRYNAEIDATHCTKPRAKPRKKRLMVDIYTTAPYSTLEELDRRNGTNWATDLSLVAPPTAAADANLETKSKKLSVSDTLNRGNVGDIYVDSNGTKILILSKFDNLLPAISGKNFKLKKGAKASRTSYLIDKKKRLKLQHHKFTKDNPRKKKLKGFRGEIDAGSKSKRDNIVEAHREKEEFLSHILSSQEQVKNSEAATLGHWVCSKRSNLSRKLYSEDASKGSEAIESSPRTKTMNILSTERARDFLEKSPRQPSSFNFKLTEADTLILSPNLGCHPSLKARKCLASKKSAFSKRTPISLEETREGAECEKLVSLKKFQKRRSISGCHKWLGREKSVSNVDGGCHGSTEGFGFISSRATKLHDNHQSNFSENQENGSSGMTNRLKSAVNLNPSHGEHESQIESPPQRPTHNQDAQCCWNAISNQTISRGIDQIAGEPEPTVHLGDFQTDTAYIQEPNACYNQDNSMTVDMESSGSSVSTTSAICSSSLQDDELRDSEADQSAELPVVQDKLSSRAVRKDKANLSPPVREPSCSCSQSLSQEPHFTNRIGKKMVSNLFGMESTTRSAVSVASLKSAANISSPCSRSRIQAASNPILRLMGKDLVVSKEKPMRLPHILPCDPDCYFSTAKLISFGIPADPSGFNHNSYCHFQIQSAANQQISFQRQLRRSEKLTSTSQCSINRMVAPHQCWPIQADQAPPREVIVIDNDSRELGAKGRRNFTPLPRTNPNSNLIPSQRAFSCLPSQNPYASTTTTTPLKFHPSTNPSGYFAFPLPSSLYFSPPRR